MKLDALEIIGWIGMVLILIAYITSNLDLLNLHSLPYLLMNLVGSISLVLVAWRKRDLQPAALNLIWSVIALVSLARLIV